MSDNENYNALSDGVKNIIAYADDVTLSYHGETSTSGMRVKFILPTNTKEHPFKRFTSREKNKGGQRFNASFTPIIEVPEDGRTAIVDPNPALHKKINIELILTHWGQTSTAGRTVGFLVLPVDGETGHPFEPFDVGKAKGGGQRFACAFVQLNDDETPVVQALGKNDILERDRDTLEDKKDVTEEKKKEKKPFGEWLPSRQSGYLCNRKDFKGFLNEIYPSYSEYSTDNADTIRKIFRIASRKELNKEPLKSQWSQLLVKYDTWKDDLEFWCHA